MASERGPVNEWVLWRLAWFMLISIVISHTSTNLHYWYLFLQFYFYFVNEIVKHIYCVSPFICDGPKAGHCNYCFLKALSLEGHTHQVQVCLSGLSFPSQGESRYGRSYILYVRQRRPGTHNTLYRWGSDGFWTLLISINNASAISALFWSHIIFSQTLLLPFRIGVDSPNGNFLNNLQNQELQPCAFISFHLNPTEWNYNIRNREALAVKETVEEWKHWLEGGKESLDLHKDSKKTQWSEEFNRPCEGV